MLTEEVAESAALFRAVSWNVSVAGSFVGLTGAAKLGVAVAAPGAVFT